MSPKFCRATARFDAEHDVAARQCNSDVTVLARDPPRRPWDSDPAAASGAGLRRTELAARAGISVEYLTRIEQGRPQPVEVSRQRHRRRPQSRQPRAPSPCLSRQDQRRSLRRTATGYLPARRPADHPAPSASCGKRTSPGSARPASRPCSWRRWAQRPTGPIQAG
jgi:hypothetical protein